MIALLYPDGSFCFRSSERRPRGGPGGWAIRAPQAAAVGRLAYWAARSALAQTPPCRNAAISAIAGILAAVDIVAGTRAGQLLGLTRRAAALSGVLSATRNYPDVRRQRSRQDRFNNFAVADPTQISNKLAQIPGASCGTACFALRSADEIASRVLPAYNGRPSPTARPYGLYRTLVRQSLFSDQTGGANRRVRDARIADPNGGI